MAKQGTSSGDPVGRAGQSSSAGRRSRPRSLGALLAMLMATAGAMFGPAGGAIADLAPTTTPAAPTVAPAATVAASIGTPSVTPIASTATPAATVTEVATSAPTVLRTATIAATTTIEGSPTVDATASATATPKVTVSPTIAPTTTPRVVAFSGVTARARIGRRSFTPTPSVDLVLVGAPSLAVGPGQVVTLDVYGVASATFETIGLDVFLDYDPTRLKLESIDASIGPFETVLSRTWDNDLGIANLAVGRLVGPTGFGVFGDFPVARLTFRASGQSDGTRETRVSFANDESLNRQTAILSATESGLRTASPATVTLLPAAVASPPTPEPPTAVMSEGIAGDITFHIHGRDGLPAVSVPWTAAARGGVRIVGTPSGVSGTGGTVTVRIAADGQVPTGLVIVTAGGTQLFRAVTVTPSVPVGVTIATPTFDLVHGTVDLRAEPTYGPVPIGSRFEVEWRYYRAEGDVAIAVEPRSVVPVVAGVATGTWDTTALQLAPIGVTRTGVILEAEARAVDATGVTIGLATATFGPMTIDNQAPDFAAVSVAGQPVADNPTIRTRIATHTFAVAGVTEDGATVAAFRRDSLSGDRTPLATVVATSVGTTRVGVRPRALGTVSAREVVAPASASFTLELPSFADADETARGFYLELESTDVVGNVGPVAISTVNGRPVATSNPYQGWLTLDTVAPHVATIATPTFTMGDANAGSRPITITFSEPVALRPSDYGTKIRLEQEILDIPEPIAGVLQVDCAPDVRPTGPVTVSPDADGSCAAGVTVARIVPSVPWYPGGTFHVTVASGDDAVDDLSPVAVADLAGNRLIGTVDGTPNTHMAFIAPGVPAFPTALIGGMLATPSFSYVIHGTASSPLILRATTTNVDTDLTWRLCAADDCSETADVDGTGIAIASPTFQVNWNTETVPDRRDAYLVVAGRNRQISGLSGRTSDFRRVTLRKTAPAITVADVQVAPCPPGAQARVLASGTFVVNDDCEPATGGLQVAFTGTVADAVPGSVTVSQSFAAGNTVVSVARHENGDAATPTAWTTSRGTVVDGAAPAHLVTLMVEARDDAIPVANVTRLTVAATVDTVAPRVSLAYPPDAARLSAPTGTLAVPVIGVASEGHSDVALAFTRNGQAYKIGGQDVTTIRATDTGAFRLPEIAQNPAPDLQPGTYVLVVRATDPIGNVGQAATATFQITPPPPVGALDVPAVPGSPGLIGPSIDEDQTTPGIQVTIRGHLPTNLTADAVPDGLIAILRRDGADATGDGGRPIVAPVTGTVGAYTFAFPPLTFARTGTATFAVATRDASGNRSPDSADVPVTIDLTAPKISIAAPRDSASVGSLRPELVAAVALPVSGMYDAATATFEIREAGTGTFRLVKQVPVTDTTLKATNGLAKVLAADWGDAPLPSPSGTPAQQAYDLRVTVTDVAGNATTTTSGFTLRPGVPEVSVTVDGVAALGVVDITSEDAPEIGITATPSGDGVTIRQVTATVRNRTTGVTTPLTVAESSGSRTATITNTIIPNGTVHDLNVVVTDSNGVTAASGATLRVVRPRSIALTVTRGATPVVGAQITARRDEGDLPAITAASGPNDQTTDATGSVSLTGLTGGPVVIAVDGVAGYPTTTVVATITEPQATAEAPWEVALDLDRLNPNIITATLRGLPTQISSSPDGNVLVEVVPAAGARYIDAIASLSVRQSFANEVATVARREASPVLASGSPVTATVHVPLGAVAWRVSPRLGIGVADTATIKGATSADALFTTSSTGEMIATAFRYVATNLRVKDLSGAVRLPDGRGVASARVIISQAGGLSVATTTDLDGAFGPIKLEAGDYIVAAQSEPGASWLPGKAGRISFTKVTTDGAPAAETGTVEISAIAAGGTVRVRLERLVAGATSLTTGTVTLRGEGRSISGAAGAAVAPGQDEMTGANAVLAAPGGTYVMSVVPDDTTLAAPDDVVVRVISGKTTTVTATELPPLQQLLGRLTGKVALTTGEAVAGMTVQARREGFDAVIPVVSDVDGAFTLSVPAGRYTVTAAVPRGAAVLPGGSVSGTVSAQTTTTLSDLLLTPASAVIERTLVKQGVGTATTPFTDDEASMIAGTAFVKNQATGRGTSVTFSGSRVRISVPPGTYRLGISITAGGYLAPEAELGVVAAAATPNTAVRALTPSNVPVRGTLVSGTSASAVGTAVALRATVRATGVAGPANGVVNVTESDATGAFGFSLAPGTWRLAASPDASQGYLANVDRPYTVVTIGADGSVSPASPTIDLSAANRTLTGRAVVAINGADVPLVGVTVRADVSGVDGSFVSIATETASDGTYSVPVPSGAIVVGASGITARYGASSARGTIDDPALIVNPRPVVIASDGTITDIVLRFLDAAIVVSGTAKSDGGAVAGANISATSSDGLVRATTSLAGTRAGEFALRLSAGTWAIAATADLPNAIGGRVPAASAAVTKMVDAANITGVELDLIAAATALPPEATGTGDPETGAQVRAGLDSAELRLAPGAVSEAVSVQVVPLGNVPSLPGFVPYGDAFRVGVTSASTGLPLASLSVDSTILITYPLSTLREFRAPSTASHGSVAAQPADLQAARYDAISGTYTPISTVTSSELSATTGQFAISTTVLGTYVLTTREALVRIPPSVVSVTTASTGAVTAGSSVVITITFSVPVTTTGTSILTLETGTVDAVATCPAVTASTTLTCTYVVGASDVTTRLNYASTSALVGTIADVYGTTAVLTLPSLETSGLYLAQISIAPASNGGGGGTNSGATTTVAVPSVRAAPAVTAVITSPVTTVPQVTATTAIVAPPGIDSGRLAAALASFPSGLTPATARAIEQAIGAVDITAARAFVDTLVRLGGSQAGTVLEAIARSTPDEARAIVVAIAAAPAGSTIGQPTGRLAAANGTEVLTFAIEDLSDAPQATVIGSAEVAGARTATTTRGPVVFLVRTGQSALVTRPRSGDWPRLWFPLLFGNLAGSGPTVVPPTAMTAVTFEPAPSGLNVVERGSLGGGVVVPLTAPFAIRTDTTDGAAPLTITMPSPKVGAGQALGYLYSLRGASGKFLGYLRAPSVFDGATNTQSWTLDAKAAADLLILPSAIQPAYVQNFSPEAHIYSGPDEFGVDFGEAGPAFTTFTVVAPQVGGRIYVYSPISKGYGWIDADGVGPSGPPLPNESAPSPPSTPRVTPEADVPAADDQTFVQNRDANVHLWSSPFDDAVDYGPIGSFVTFEVIDGPENGHVRVRSTRTGNEAWLDLNDAVDAPPPS